tara:strand:+ start:160 stop:507 length:348 start_codon:yes stop_codon:yes gene_type:complete
MVAANHFGRGVLLNDTISGQTNSQIFQDYKHGVRKTVVCVYSTIASTSGGFVIEVEDPTVENTSTTFSGFQLTSATVSANTLEKIIIDAGAGSRLRCSFTPDGSGDVKIWAWSSD